MKISTEEKKAMIIQNFVSLLKQYGIEKVTLNDVAEKSGLTKSALYYYFDSKETLMLASFKKYRAMMLERLDSTIKKAKNPKETIKLYCDFLFDLPQDLLPHGRLEAFRFNCQDLRFRIKLRKDFLPLADDMIRNDKQVFA